MVVDSFPSVYFFFVGLERKDCDRSVQAVAKETEIM
jgi:hypothetical protein